MAKLPCRKKCPENMQRQCRLEFGYAGMPPCAKLVVKKLTAHNKPMAEMTWVREAFAIAMKHSVDNNYREMWKSRKNAVLWSLRHR